MKAPAKVSDDNPDGSAGNAVSRRGLLAAAPVATAAAASYEPFEAYLTRSQRTDLGSGLAQVDMTDALQRAIDGPAGAASTHVALSPASVLRVLGTVYLPANVTIDLGGSLLRGNGGNTLFETGMRSAGRTRSNFSAPNETQIVFKSEVANGAIADAGIAFRLQNFCEGSALTNLRMTNVRQPLYARRCFFASFRRLVARASTPTRPAIAFRFDDAVNAIDLNGLVSEGYKTGFWFDGQKGGTLIQNCSVENGEDGMVFLDPTAALTLAGNYFENLSGAGLRFGPRSAHDNVFVSGNWFYGTKIAVEGPTVRSGTWGRNNALAAATVILGSTRSTGLTVEIPDGQGQSDLRTGLPPAYRLGAGVLVDHVRSVHAPATIAVRGRVHNGPIPHSYEGSGGRPTAGTIPFCTYSVASGNVPTLVIDTPIQHSPFEMLGYAFEITTASGVVSMAGVIAGLHAIAAGTSPKEVVVVEHEDRVRLVIRSFSASDLPLRVTGVVRHL